MTDIDELRDIVERSARKENVTPEEQEKVIQYLTFGSDNPEEETNSG